MTASPAAAGVPPRTSVELLERAIGYTCGTLATVTPGALDLTTPCERWRLADLLAHMEDSLDAFAEGAGGAIGLRSAAPTPPDERLAALRAKATGLLGAWTRRLEAEEAGLAGRDVGVSGVPAPVAVVAGLAAVEVAVHGWDVGRATGAGGPLPGALAADLLPWADLLRAATDSGPGASGFAGPLPTAVGPDPARALLGRLGRAA
ncbi:maleylpyruvate isomerase family mycothiol-dependent enzyme [Nocardioides sp. GY 10113]|uniref:maleylpyruvate isomerase family mycothiol-dependent enzyme n=1 Tax=Nocardioides sp. GY 10113 TaxID=2569761 RepID=UPI0010A84009|nr:maleylpyruvate isomerase family mycothiol-dependent enzyme [Nocardioides sp. GY 10113]TIC82259.1 maleylpyruvate isomerase family mycothiol-dependent enzyme [Nocardioides sp. GY 10113]